MNANDDAVTMMSLYKIALSYQINIMRDFLTHVKDTLARDWENHSDDASRRCIYIYMWYRWTLLQNLQSFLTREWYEHGWQPAVEAVSLGFNHLIQLTKYQSGASLLHSADVFICGSIIFMQVVLQLILVFFWCWQDYHCWLNPHIVHHLLHQKFSD